VNPIAAAALANGPAAAPRKSAAGFGAKIFSKVTGLAGRDRQAQAEPRTAPAAKPEPRLQQPASPRAPQPTQPKLGGLEPMAPTPPAPGGQEDLLDIPAFLRRQAN
jgi:cell division protein FtsZ